MIKLPLVGPAYKMKAQSMSCQNCINWYPQTIEYPNGSRVAALMPTPGLKKIFQGVTSAVRGLNVLSNGALLVVIGNKLYHSKANKFDLVEVGSISALGTVRFADNGRVALIVNGTYTYSLDLKKLTLTRLSGSAIPRSTHVAFLDGRFVFNKANTGQFHWSDLYSTNVNALSYATAESTPDNVTAIIEFNSTELWLFGSQSVERYYGTGSANAPFSRLSGGAMSFGCLAPDSIVSLSTGVIWLGVSEFGGNQIVMSGGGLPERISTHAIEEEIASFSKTSDASAYAYQMEGHVFYVISFPSANMTFCFDVSTGLWHQRSFANAQGLHERHRSQHHAYFNNTHIVGDYRNGKLYQLDNNIFTDDGELILRERTAQAVITDQKLTRFNQLQIICETGFYGEVKKEDPKPPEISCEGATQSIVIHGYARILESGEEHVQLTETIKLNGSVINEKPSYIVLETVGEPPLLPPEGYFWTGSRRATNTSNQNVRIEQTFTPVGQKDFKMFTAENPTVINEFDVYGRISYCLLANSNPEPVGCEGSITSCTMGTLTSGGYYKIYVNDVEIIESTRLFIEEEWARSLSKILKDDFNVVLVPLKLDLSLSTDPYFNDVENGRFENQNNQYIKLRIVTIDASAINQQFEPMNGSFQLTPRPNEGASFCLSPYKQVISCDGATNTADTGGIWGDVTMTVNGALYDAVMPIDGVLEVDYRGELHSTFKNISDQNLRIRITSSRLLSSDFGWEENKNPTLMVDFNVGLIEFCLSSNIDTCVALPPVNLNLDKTLYLLDNNKQYYLYYRNSSGEVIKVQSVPNNFNENEGIFSISDFPRLNGFIVDYSSETEFYPETCNTYVYEGNFYVDQRVQTWENYHFIGSFYVEVNGERNYLQNSSTNFPHKGTSTTLRELLEPYYKNVAAFLMSFGVEAVYNPEFWGSYNTGGVKVTRTTEQYENIKFGSETGYDLMFNGFSERVCTSFKNFDELENGPSKLSIEPSMSGNPGKNEYTLLGTYEPPNESEINLLNVIGVVTDINISSCFEDVPS
jgi:hypothetical protein